MVLSVIVANVGLAGCATRSFEDGPIKWSETTFGFDASAQLLKVKYDKDTRELIVEGAETTQTQAIRAAVEGAVRGASKAAGAP